MLQTPLNAWHRQHDGRMVDFAGWEMPVQYSSIVEEHCAVRTAVGLFDISHMGRLEFRGDAAGEFLNQVLTNDTARLHQGDIRYSLICRPDGGILDDVLIYRLPDRWFLVVNASNRLKIVEWLRQQPEFDGCGFSDLTLSTGMIAVQGPRALDVVSAVSGADLGAMKYYSGQEMRVGEHPLLISRTGYTGEDGFELVVASDVTEQLCEKLMAAGRSMGILPAGLGCRDTLRLEAGMPLYGHELNEEIDPLSAGLDFAVRLGKSAFIGRETLHAIRDRGLSKVRVGLVLDGRRIAREHTAVLNAGQAVGKVTSGTFSPTLQKSIAMAFVSVECAQAGHELQVDLRGSMISAEVTPLPFYRRT